MITPHVRGRSRLARRLSWFVVATMVLAAIVAPSTAGSVLAASPAEAAGTRIALGSQNECEDRDQVHSGDCESPSGSPSGSPGSSPSSTPSSSPSGSPSATPTGSPSATPSGSPSATPSGSPSGTPTGSPSGTPTGSPSGTPTGTPTGSPSGDAQASILIFKFDNKGTPELEDDSTLDGATFEVYADDGDEVFDDILDTLVFGPASTDGGTVETGPLDAGWYWIVETIVPDGFEGSDPILVELNLDAEVRCIWDATGLVDCIGNDGENEFSSWTWVEVENTPEDPDESPDGSALGETGTPEITLPPTDTMTGANDAGASQGWRLVILAMAGLIAAALLLTPARLLISTDERRR